MVSGEEIPNKPIHGKLPGFDCYPLVNEHFASWKITMFFIGSSTIGHGFHRKLLNYQRVMEMLPSDVLG